MEDDEKTDPCDSIEGSTLVARENPFLRFAFTPGTSVSNSVQGTLHFSEQDCFAQDSNSALGKRKQHDNSLTNASPYKREKKGLSVSSNVGDSLPVPFSLPSPGSKRVKVYDHLQEIGDHLGHGLDGECHSRLSSWRPLTHAVVIFCGIKYCDSSRISFQDLIVV